MKKATLSKRIHIRWCVLVFHDKEGLHARWVAATSKHRRLGDLGHANRCAGISWNEWKEKTNVSIKNNTNIWLSIPSGGDTSEMGGASRTKRLPESKQPLHTGRLSSEYKSQLKLAKVTGWSKPSGIWRARRCSSSRDTNVRGLRLQIGHWSKKTRSQK